MKLRYRVYTENRSVAMKSLIIRQEKIFNSTIDAIKGIAIFLVLWGHCIQFSGGEYNFFENIVFKIIYSFHMPLFMLVSGYLFYSTLQRKTLKNILISKGQGILLPLIVWTSLYYFLSQTVSGILKDGIKFSFSAWYNTVIGNFLWYLWSLLFISIGLALVIKLLSKKIYFIGILLLLLLLAFLPNGTMNIFMYPYFIIGYYFRKYENTILKFKWIGIYGLIIYIILMSLYNENCYIYTSGINLFNSKLGFKTQLLIDIYRYIIGLLGSISIVFLFTSIIKSEYIKKVIGELGRFSMQIYIMQCLCLSWLWSTVWRKIIEQIGYNPLFLSEKLYSFVITPIMAILVAVLLYWISRLIGKLPKVSKLLFGR